MSRDTGSATRSFLEYLAAEYIVRTHRHGEGLWSETQPHVVGGSWKLVGQIALQLFDRNVDHEAEEVLGALLREGQSEELETRVASITFAARPLAHLRAHCRRQTRPSAEPVRRDAE